MVSIGQQTLKAGRMGAGALPGLGEDLVYAGFWRRFFAVILDSIILSVVAYVVGAGVFTGTMAPPEAQDGVNVSFSFDASGLVPALLGVVYAVGFWVAKGATPGKMALGLRIVRAEDGGAIGAGKALLRYLGYFVSGLFLALGFIWVAFDRRKQGWHDKIAGTVVVTRQTGQVRWSRGSRHHGFDHDRDYDRDDDRDFDSDGGDSDGGGD